MELFFCSKIETDNFFLDEEESHHLFKVMRHAVGDELMVTDGKGKLIRARITQEHKKRCVLELIEVVKEESSLSPAVHIAIAPTRNIDRFEWFLGKSTEIGVTEITPVLCQRSERERIKQERMEKILIGAMKQSLRLWLPKLNSLVPLKFFFNPESSLAKASKDKAEIRNPPSLQLRQGFVEPAKLRWTGPKFIAHCQSQNLPSLQSLYKPNGSVLILIGPEGDFTPEEIQLAEVNGFSAVTLGKNRLRTETAGIVAVHTIQILNTQ